MDNQNTTQPPILSPNPPENPLVTPNPQTQPVSSPKSKKMIVIIGILLLLVLIGTGGYLLGVKKGKPSITPSATNTPTPKTVTKTFSKLGITFQYPENALITEESSNATSSATVKQSDVRFSLKGKEFVLDKISAPVENEAPYNQTSLIKEFNGTAWKVVPPSQTDKICDMGTCGKTTPSYYVYKNGYRYSFTYYSDDLQPTIEAILSTVSFTN